MSPAPAFKNGKVDEWQDFASESSRRLAHLSRWPVSLTCLTHQVGSVLRQRIALFPPATDAAIHGDDVCVTHLLEIIGSKGGAETAAAVKNYFCVEVRDFLFDVPLDNALAEVKGAGKVVLGIFAFFTDVDKKKFVTFVNSLLDFIDVGFANAGFRVVDNFQETRGMLMGHGKFLVPREKINHEGTQVHEGFFG
jgi:hypothetical protein